MKIFRENQRARYYTTIYVDAFAGTGYRSVATRKQTASQIEFEEFAEADTQSFLKGSARIALDINPSFDRYVFVERKPDFVVELQRLRDDFPGKAPYIQVVQQEANTFLRVWCDDTNWNKCRAVVFLDPYGMQVDWETLQRIARTQAIDLWLLFPLGTAVNRLLTQHKPPPDHWANALTRVLGTDEWRSEFYKTATLSSLFGEVETKAKSANFDAIGQFFVRQLKTIFAGVASNPLTLRNSKGNPLYLLCFASGNPRGSTTAIKIAQDILRD